jgi:membrane protease subunit HflK
VEDPVALCRRLADPAGLATADVANPVEGLLRSLTRRAVIRTMAHFPVDDALGGERDTLRREVAARLVRQLDALEVGIKINDVILQDIVPPLRTKKAFDEVNAAAQEKDRLIQEAKGYQVTKTTEAGGQASRIVNDANEYKSRVATQAEADAKYIKSILEEYPDDPETLSLFLEQRRIEVLEETLAEADETFVLELGSGSARREVRVWLNRDPDAVQETRKRRQQELKEKKGP